MFPSRQSLGLLCQSEHLVEIALDVLQMRLNLAEIVDYRLQTISLSRQGSAPGESFRNIASQTNFLTGLIFHTITKVPVNSLVYLIISHLRSV